MGRRQSLLELETEEIHSLPTLYPSMNWVIAHGFPNKLEAIRKQLHHPEVMSVTVPFWVHVARRNEADVLAVEPIFPGYLFVDLVAPVTNWTTLEDAEGIVRVLTTNMGPVKCPYKVPYLLKPEEVAYIIGLTNDSLKLMEPETYQLLDSEVIITDGIFRNFRGTVVEDGSNLKISLDVPNRPFYVRIDRQKVAKIIE